MGVNCLKFDLNPYALLLTGIMDIIVSFCSRRLGPSALSRRIIENMGNVTSSFDYLSHHWRGRPGASSQRLRALQQGISPAVSGFAWGLAVL